MINEHKGIIYDFEALHLKKSEVVRIIINNFSS